MDFERYQPDLEAYVEQTVNGPCFICQILASNPEYQHHLVLEDEVAIAFLDKYPPLFGHTLVAPVEHREQVTGDFSLSEYLELQKRVFAVSEALRQELGAERIYILSLGSQQANAHVHWHISPLPPGVPLDEQQYAALSWDNGIIQLSPDEMEKLAQRIGRRIQLS